MKPKSNHKSTIAELIEMDEALLQILWTIHFFKEQVYAINENMLFQDNKSVMIMETRANSANLKFTLRYEISYSKTKLIRRKLK